MHGFIEACIFQDREQYLPYSDVSLCMLYIHQFLKSYISYATNNNTSVHFLLCVLFK
jgi:hypothetical protein